jgi:hypothetical protein
MIDITKAFRENIPFIFRVVLGSSPTGKNFMNSKIVVCNSLDDLIQHYKKIEPCYAYVPAVRFRNIEIAYPQLTDEKLTIPPKEKEFILQDRYGKAWCWAEDKTSWFKPKIKDNFSDYEIMEIIFGDVYFGGRGIRVMYYRERIKQSERQTEKYVNAMPAYFSI